MNCGVCQKPIDLDLSARVVGAVAATEDLLGYLGLHGNMAGVAYTDSALHSLQKVQRDHWPRLGVQTNHFPVHYDCLHEGD